MKISALLLLIGFLSACSTLPKQNKTLVYSNNIPNAWTLEGKISAVVNHKTTVAGFELNRQNGYYHLILSGASGFGQIEAKQTKQGLLVNGVLTQKMLQSWIKDKVGVYMPIAELENIIFKPAEIPLKNWQIKVTKRQLIDEISYPKIIHFKHIQRAIKLKLLIRDLTRTVAKKALYEGY